MSLETSRLSDHLSGAVNQSYLSVVGSAPPPEAEAGACITLLHLLN